MKNWEKIITTNGEEKLHREFLFGDFYDAAAFVLKVYLLSEHQNHHPEIHHNFKKVSIYLTTHDLGNKVSEKDQKLANAIDKFFQ